MSDERFNPTCAGVQVWYIMSPVSTRGLTWALGESTESIAMPLNTEADYARLAEHLGEIDHVVEPFSVAHGYTLPKWPLSGRYPNRQMHSQGGMVWRSIQITMDLRPDGERFDEFFPEIPYTVCGTVWVDDFTSLIRWHAPSIRTEGIPFRQLMQTIPLYLSHFHDYISSLDEHSIRAFHRTSQLSRLPEL